MSNKKRIRKKSTIKSHQKLIIESRTVKVYDHFIFGFNFGRRSGKSAALEELHKELRLMSQKDFEREYLQKPIFE